MDRFTKIKRNLPYCLFIAFGLKLAILGSATLFEVLTLFVVGLMVGFFELALENAKFQELSNKIKELEKKDQEFSASLAQKSQEIQEFNKKVESVRVVAGMKQVR